MFVRRGKLYSHPSLPGLIETLTENFNPIPNHSFGTAPDIRMYLRVERMVATNHVFGQALKIAHIEVSKHARRQGVFKRWLLEIEEAVLLSPYLDFVYLENVVNPHLEAYIVRRGYKPCQGPSGSTGAFFSFFKKMEVAKQPADSKENQC